MMPHNCAYHTPPPDAPLTHARQMGLGKGCDKTGAICIQYRHDGFIVTVFRSPEEVYGELKNSQHRTGWTDDEIERISEAIRDPAPKGEFLVIFVHEGSTKGNIGEIPWIQPPCTPKNCAYVRRYGTTHDN